MRFSLTGGIEKVTTIQVWTSCVGNFVTRVGLNWFTPLNDDEKKRLCVYPSLLQIIERMVPMLRFGQHIVEVCTHRASLTRQGIYSFWQSADHYPQSRLEGFIGETFRLRCSRGHISSEYLMMTWRRWPWPFTVKVVIESTTRPCFCMNLFMLLQMSTLLERLSATRILAMKITYIFMNEPDMSN